MGLRIFIFTILLVINLKSFSQDTAKVYFSGIAGREIKKSQLLDNSIKLITNSKELENCYLALYLVCYKSQCIFQSKIKLGTSLREITKLYRKYKHKHDCFNKKQDIYCLNELTFDIICVDKDTKIQTVFGGEHYKITSD